MIEGFETVPPPPPSEEEVWLMKLVSGEEIIAVAYRSDAKVYVSKPRKVHNSALDGRWVTGLKVEQELTNHPIIGYAVIAIVKEGDIYTNLLREYKEEIELIPGFKRFR